MQFHDVKFTDGSDQLKPFGKSLTKLNFNFVSPDGNPASILRAAIFSAVPPASSFSPTPLPAPYEASPSTQQTKTSTAAAQLLAPLDNPRLLF
jgi:hypothetical protein